MTEAMWLSAAVVTVIVGMGWLALAYQSHWQQVFPTNQHQPNSVALKWAGWSFLLMSGVCCFIADHPTMAALVWVMLLAVSAMLVAIILSHQPALLRMICLPFFSRNSK